MNSFDEILSRVGLKYEELRPDERETLNTWTTALQAGPLTVDQVAANITRMRETLEKELTDIKSKTPAWITVLSIFVPLVAIILKWYQDQEELGLKARLRNCLMIEAMITGPEKRRADVNRQIDALASRIKT